MISDMTNAMLKFKKISVVIKWWFNHDDVVNKWWFNHDDDNN